MIDVVIDTSVKMALLGLVAWLVTQRAGLAQARLAHAAWLGVIVISTALPGFSLWVAPSMSIVPSRTLAGLIPAAQPDLAGWIAGIYLSGTAVLALRLVIGLREIRYLRRESQPVQPAGDRETALVHTCAAHGAILVETDAVSMPATAGGWRPAVFLPAGWRALDPAVVDAIVAHELAHVRRHAYSTTVAARIFRTIFWFHPVAWLACARLRWFEELACDREASRADPLRYAKALLAVARLSAVRNPALALSGGSQLGNRVDLLLSHRPSAVGGTATVVAAALGIAVVLCLPFVSFRLSALSAAPTDGAAADHAAVHAQRHAAHPH